MSASIAVVTRQVYEPLGVVRPGDGDGGTMAGVMGGVEASRDTRQIGQCAKRLTGVASCYGLHT